jgi:hypothetical protein
MIKLLDLTGRTDNTKQWCFVNTYVSNFLKMHAMTATYDTTLFYSEIWLFHL